jgi:hypothetical protein
MAAVGVGDAAVAGAAMAPPVAALAAASFKKLRRLATASSLILLMRRTPVVRLPRSLRGMQRLDLRCDGEKSAVNI